MTAWLRATALKQAAFASRPFGRGADDPVVRDLHSAALGAATATNHDGLREATGKLARAMEAVGIDRCRISSPTPKSAPATRPRKMPSRRAGSRRVRAAMRSGRFTRLRRCSVLVPLPREQPPRPALWPEPA